MKVPDRLTFKFAEEASEMEQIHELNYRTFVREIPQHAPREDQRLVDKFHDENTYGICLSGDRLIGMIACRGKRPFSLDGKLADLDSYLPAQSNLCEIRLLAVEPAFRGAPVFCGLVQLVERYMRENGHDRAVMSGVIRQQKLYRHLGFAPFGPVVGSGEARFQPMQLALKDFCENPAIRPVFIRGDHDEPAVLLPGPVGVHRDVRNAFAAPPVSHRSPGFARDLRAVQKRLCALVNCRAADVFLGSGSLANDVIAGQLSLLSRPGLILNNGEFGARLIDHAGRFNLEFERVEKPWGEAISPGDVERALAGSPNIGWLWAVHCETSTGVMNDLEALKELCRSRGLILCLDCISSVGSMPVDLKGAHFASGVSGKGLAAYPGLGLVFRNVDVVSASGRLPRYLDLGFHVERGGVPFTHSSNLVAALRCALEREDWSAKFDRIARVSDRLRRELAEAGFNLVAAGAARNPAVITIALPLECDSRRFAESLERAGFMAAWQSEYLQRRNWIQVCLMGEIPDEAIVTLPDRMRKARAASEDAKRALQG